MNKQSLWLTPQQYPNPNRQAFDAEVKTFFGLPPKAKWPPEGMAKRTIQGIECWVEPKEETRFEMRWGKNRAVKSSKHRTFGICPACGKTVPLGRMQQHAKIHKEY
ncbi:hypothetical protein UFOVP1254_29 [uncultured Caudovirales phage]|uniref:Uncharacterized protein n=1 Tax=uncultured Caudovirales phage TaxID=2100421 RepID=A0A6J5RPX8_9CAUD|nr:hypothetical protein UFOVP1254_29 [uncultured Caudovirales phage]